MERRRQHHNNDLELPEASGLMISRVRGVLPLLLLCYLNPKP